MAQAAASSRRSRRTIDSGPLRYTIDASVFVNAFNAHEHGHAESLQLLTAIQERGNPVIVPSLLIAEIAAALARLSNDAPRALQHADAIAALAHVTLVVLTSALAGSAAELAATRRLRASDAVYFAVTRRFATTLISRDHEQLSRGSRVAPCLTPEQALRRV